MKYFISNLNEYKISGIPYYQLINSIHLDFKLDTYSYSRVLYLKKNLEFNFQRNYIEFFYNFLKSFISELAFNYPGIDLIYYAIKQSKPARSIDDPLEYFDKGDFTPNILSPIVSIGKILFGDVDCGIVEFKSTNNPKLKSFVLIRFMVGDSYYDFLIECQLTYRDNFIKELYHNLYEDSKKSFEKIRVYCNKHETDFVNHFLNNSLDFQVHFATSRTSGNVLVDEAITFCKENGYNNFNVFLIELFNKLIK